MAVAEGLTVRERAAYLEPADCLVIADLHLGRAATAGIDLPLDGQTGVRDRLGRLLARFSPGEVVIAGDVLDAFSRVPPGVEAKLEAIEAQIADADAGLTVVAGNHDPMLEDLLDTVDECRVDRSTVVCHGHETPTADADRYVIGHDHPAIVIEGRRRPCYLVGIGTYGDADVIVLPAFNGLLAGTPVNRAGRDGLQSPLIDPVDAFQPVVRDPEADETLTFPPLGSLREFL